MGTLTVARTVAEVRAWVRALRRTGARVALVPTMGALHAGHLAHVAACRADVHAVVMSIFVNPTQFGPGEDYARYPRDLERDLNQAARAGVDLVFAPSVEEMYPGGAQAAVDPGPLGAVLEGAARPGHFRGVATVVTKLLHAVEPDVVTFGQKDAQQLVLVRRLVRELLLPVEVRTVPTVRAADGLALSSRHAYLSPEDRAAATVVWRALRAAVARLQAGERGGRALESAMAAEVAREPRARLDYARVVDAEGFAPLERVQGRVLCLLAAAFGGTRLLDNVCLRVGEAAVEEVLL